MRRTGNIANNIDWITVTLFYLLILLGWLNIFASVFDENTPQNIFDIGINSGRQLIFIGTTIILFILILAVDNNFYDTFAYIIYGAVILLLIYVFLFAREINGAKSWLQIGGFNLQPSEFAKFSTALVLAKFMSSQSFRITKFRDQVILAMIIGLPVGLIILQGDTGTALVFGAFLLVLFREGLSPIILLGGIGAAVLFILTLLLPQIYLLPAFGVIVLIAFILGKRSFKRFGILLGIYALIAGTINGVDFAFHQILKPHQQNRILVLINPNTDPLGAGWNVTQSKIAIGSGGIFGKGFLNGTQTKGDFVPEQSTDFIFCTIGEEHGWIGSLILISLFTLLLLRIIYIAERQKQKFSRIYGYSVASILFAHFTINIGMTIGLFPVIGIPLPFFSYGGSSLLAFTILLFILLKLDSHRNQILAH